MSRKLIKGNMMCRICEHEVPCHLFTSHSDLCAVKTQWEVRSLECNNYLRKLHSVFIKIHESYRKASLPSRRLDTVLDELEVMTTEAILETDRDALKAMAESLLPYKEDPSLNQLQSHIRELEEWLLYKEVVGGYIEASRSFLLTIFGEEVENEELRIPSLHDFDILQYLARGGFAVVFLAKKHQDYYAIKVLDRHAVSEKTQMANVFAERNIMATTSCPYVVPMFYAFATNDHLFLAMEFLYGGDLGSFHSQVQAFEENVAQFYLAEIVLALEYLHEQGIVHRGT